jgi:glucokinase
MFEDDLYLGIDLGGTNVKAIAMTEGGTRLCEINRSVEAERGPEKVMERIASLAEEVIGTCASGKKQLRAIGVAAAGIVDMKLGLCRFLPNLPGWINVPLVQDLYRRVGLETFLINDVRAITLAETSYGAGKNVPNLVCMAVGTGIGGGIVINGSLYFGSEGLACEIGHQIIEPQGPRCTCGSRGCLEALASGSNIAYQAMRIVRQGGATLIRDLVAGDLNLITPEIVADAARKGDPYALEIWEREAFYLGLGLTNMVVVLDPDMIILGGGVAEAFDLVSGGIMKTLRERVKLGHDLERLQLVKGELRDLAGAVGAAAWARMRMKGSVMC